MDRDSRAELSQRVIFSGSSNTSLPDPKSPLNVYCDARTDTLLSYTDDIGLPFSAEEMHRQNGRPIVMSARMQLARDILLQWLQPSDNNKMHHGTTTTTTTTTATAVGDKQQQQQQRKRFEHILLIGADGCGKECLLQNCFEQTAMMGGGGRKLVTMCCAAQTNAVHLEQLVG